MGLIRHIFGDRKGSALIFVIWVMIFLSALGLEFAYSMRTESESARNFKEDTEAYYAAVAGIEYAKAEILASGELMYLDDNGQLVLNEKRTPSRQGQIGNVTYAYTIIDEERKLNLNKASQAQIVYLLEHAGLEGDGLDVVADSILDWKDGDSTPRSKGAEESYYRSLSPPRSAKDGLFDSVEELLLVKGITPQIVLGSSNGKQQGVARYLTVRSSGAINVNTAARPVLQAVFGIERAGEIVAEREAAPVTAMTDGAVKSAYFTIFSSGRSNNVVRSIKVVVWKVDDCTIKTLYWNDNWIQ